MFWLASLLLAAASGGPSAAPDAGVPQAARPDAGPDDEAMLKDLELLENLELLQKMDALEPLDDEGRKP
jgi:hypothetical protein